jgi:RNA polymerase sigma factor (sigma-70 family)
MIERAHSPTDETLAAEIARRPTEDLRAELFRRYEKRVYLWCFRYTHDIEEAIELSEEIFMEIFGGLKGFSEFSRFSTWVYRAARDHCLGELAARRTRWWKRLVASGETTGEAPDETAFQCRVADLGDLERVLETARSCMEPTELEAFVLHYREGLAASEIGRMLGCESAADTRRLIQSAREKFGRFVRDEGLGDV